MATVLHPCNACFSFFMVCTQTMLIFHLSQPTPTHFWCLLYHAHALLVFHWSRLTPIHIYALGISPTHSCFSGCHFIDFPYDQIYLSTLFPWFTAGQGNILHLQLNSFTYSYLTGIILFSINHLFAYMKWFQVLLCNTNNSI